MHRDLLLAALALVSNSAPGAAQVDAMDRAVADGLVGQWALEEGARDGSALGNHGVAYGDASARGTFDGTHGYIEVPATKSLDLHLSDFTISAWIWTAPDASDAAGDLISQYDPVRRRGFNLGLAASSGGYSARGDDRHVVFGLDDARPISWEDCGRPSPTSNYVSNALTVFDGHLYAPITDAAKPADWCHVFRYEGEKAWQDCGRVGNLATHGVGGMVVHQGHLYAGTWNYDWTRLGTSQPDGGSYSAALCRVFRYAGGTEWEDCGQPGKCRRLFGMASFKGRMYVVGDDKRCYVFDGRRTWTECGRFPSYAHPMGVYDGRLYAGVLDPAGLFAFDGTKWEALGNPLGSPDLCTQIHKLKAFRGKLHVTTWPRGEVVRLDAPGQWISCGRLGDALEVNALAVYNGKLYGGAMPRAEVFRYDDGNTWTSVRRFLDPAIYPYRNPLEGARVTSFSVYDGKLFASIGSCTSSHLDAPPDIRGSVFAMGVGECVSYDRDLGSGWQHLAAVRRDRRLELFVNGNKVVESDQFGGDPIDLSNGRPLRIGFGESDYFKGRLRDVRIHRRALEPDTIQHLALTTKPE